MKIQILENDAKFFIESLLSMKKAVTIETRTDMFIVSVDFPIFQHTPLNDLYLWCELHKNDVVNILSKMTPTHIEDGDKSVRTKYHQMSYKSLKEQLLIDLDFVKHIDNWDVCMS